MLLCPLEKLADLILGEKASILILGDDGHPNGTTNLAVLTGSLKDAISSQVFRNLQRDPLPIKAVQQIHRERYHASRCKSGSTQVRSELKW